MRRLLQTTGLMILFLLATKPASAAVAVVQHVTCSSTASAVTIACTIASTGTGNLIVVGTGVVNLSSLATGVADTKCSGYVQATGAVAVNYSRSTDVWYCLSSVSAATVVTVTFSGTAGTWEKTCEVWEVSGMGTVTFDLAGTATGTGPASPAEVLGPSVTTTSTNGFVVGEVWSSNNITAAPYAGNEFTSGGDIATSLNFSGISLISTTATGHQPAWGVSAGSDPYCASTAAFKGGGAAAAPNMPPVIL